MRPWALQIRTVSIWPARRCITGSFLAGDTLNFASQNGITGSYNAATGVLTLSGSSTVAHYQAALESITFSSSSSNPTNNGTDTTRTISWKASDGTLNSNTLSSTMTVTGVDQAPVLSNGGNTVNYTEGGAAAVLDAALGTTDPDSVNLASATVSITAGFFSGDTLNFANQNGITGSYNAATGVLTLTGSASLAERSDSVRVHHLQFLQHQSDEQWYRHQPYSLLAGQ